MAAPDFDFWSQEQYPGFTHSMQPVYEQLGNLEMQLRSTIRSGDVELAKHLLHKVLPLSRQETENVGRSLGLSMFLKFAFSIDKKQYENLKKEFFKSAKKGHGWKLTRMLKIKLRDAQEFQDTELEQFCKGRLVELKNTAAELRRS